MKTWTNPTIEELEVKLTAHGKDMNHCEQCHHSVGNSNGNSSNGHGGSTAALMSASATKIPALPCPNIPNPLWLHGMQAPIPCSHFF